MNSTCLWLWGLGSCGRIGWYPIDDFNSPSTCNGPDHDSNDASTTALLGLALVTTASSAATPWHVPERGSAERAQIMDALRDKLRSYDDSQADIVFMVHSVCANDRLGWLDGLPCSRDGRNRNEQIQAVMVRRKDPWQVSELGCDEEDCAAGTDASTLQQEVGPRCGSCTPASPSQRSHGGRRCTTTSQACHDHDTRPAFRCRL